MKLKLSWNFEKQISQTHFHGHKAEPPQLKTLSIYDILVVFVRAQCQVSSDIHQNNSPPHLLDSLTLTLVLITNKLLPHDWLSGKKMN